MHYSLSNSPKHSMGWVHGEGRGLVYEGNGCRTCDTEGKWNHQSHEKNHNRVEPVMKTKQKIIVLFRAGIQVMVFFLVYGWNFFCPKDVPLVPYQLLYPFKNQRSGITRIGVTSVCSTSTLLNKVIAIKNRSNIVPSKLVLTQSPKRQEGSK